MSSRVILPLFLCATCFSIALSEVGFSQDTYVNALQDSHQTDFDNSGGGYQYSPPPNNNYLPPPTPGYLPSPVYGPPPPNFYKPAPPLPYHSHGSWFLEKLKTKLNLFTIGKIILKLLIFKKIIKFIGVICLLLFLPKLKNMFKDDTSMEEDGMESKQVETAQDILERRLEELHDFIVKSISAFEDDKSS